MGVNQSGHEGLFASAINDQGVFTGWWRTKFPNCGYSLPFNENIPEVRVSAGGVEYVDVCE